MAPSAADVPTKFDVLINSQGYVYYDPWTVGSSTSAPEKAVYTYTPTFVDRQNTQGEYGDNQQDFWLTASQKDWSEGEGQRYFHTASEDSKRKYWSGSSVNISVPGQVSLAKDVRSLSFANAVRCAVAYGRGSTTNQTDNIYACSTANLYHTNSAGSITDDGAHGLGGTPTQWGIASDGYQFIYISSESTKVRRFSPAGGTFADFSASGADALEFHNNALYGLAWTTGQILYSWSTAGTRSSLFEWKDSLGSSRALDATNYNSNFGRIKAYGGKLLILWGYGAEGRGPELWIYDGSGVSLIQQFQPNFYAHDLCILNGVVFVSGVLVSPASSNNSVNPVIFYYSNGNMGLLWKSYAKVSSSNYEKSNLVSMCVFDGSLIFNDDSTGKLMRYEIETGAISSLASYTVSGDTPILASGLNFLLHTRNQTGATLFPHNTTKSSGSTTSSLFDFDSSLNKLFRGIKVEFDSATDGDGGSVDIAYRVGDVDGSFTTLQTSAVSGTEYLLSGVSGRGLSIKVTLNKGTSTSGPLVKRVSVRAAPVQQTFRLEKYVLDNTGRSETGINDPKYVSLRDGTTHNLDGLQMATNLRTAYTLGTTISITDKFGTFTGIIEDLKQTEIRTNEFVSEVTVREV